MTKAQKQKQKELKRLLRKMDNKGKMPTMIYQANTKKSKRNENAKPW